MKDVTKRSTSTPVGRNTLKTFWEMATICAEGPVTLAHLRALSKKESDRSDYELLFVERCLHAWSMCEQSMTDIIHYVQHTVWEDPVHVLNYIPDRWLRCLCEAMTCKGQNISYMNLTLEEAMDLSKAVVQLDMRNNPVSQAVALVLAGLIDQLDLETVKNRFSIDVRYQRDVNTHCEKVFRIKIDLFKT